VFGALPGIVGSIQATEAVKLITGKGDPLIGRLLIFDALEMDFQTVRVR
jgi:adenylyltransferase/sulfurtransferase